MEWLPILFNLCIIPMLGVLTAYAVNWIKAKTNQITKQSDNDLVDKYTNMIGQTITDCVIATNQTYVESLKKQGKFDEEAQKIALQKTLEAVMTTLSKDAIDYLTNIYGDINTYLVTKIEAEVNINK